MTANILARPKVVLPCRDSIDAAIVTDWVFGTRARVDVFISSF
jgi:hypothetical protein